MRSDLTDLQSVPPTTTTTTTTTTYKLLDRDARGKNFHREHRGLGVQKLLLLLLLLLLL
jgi:hypothetical protein